ncbi:CDGSH iron-sulfur domain-containing protein [Nocardia rhamnosiphila]|uniref:CDGSH iron-sulfur domain-containing protein n=1 Tax=Nocardia rhamnosiphila TaxID=426716 RepID=UPI0027E2BCEB|nr:CDGSH iron-sulfur domain-containing protein [Nocardia zapadnayensis]
MPTEPADTPPGPDELLAAIRHADPATADDAAADDASGPRPEPARIPPDAANPVRRITFTAEGPALVEGPLEVITPEGDHMLADRFLVALCTCKRSGSYPLCDTSHRRRARRSGNDREGR